MTSNPIDIKCGGNYLAAQFAIAALFAMIALTLSTNVLAKEPSIPPGLDPGGVAVAVFGPGIDYTAKGISDHLARDGEGNPIGFDFVDDDGLPFEPITEFNNTKMRPGTTLASIIVREAPKARLAAFKLNPTEGEKLGRAAAMAGQSPVRIVLIPWTGEVAETWEIFSKAAQHFDKLLFVAAAGDENRDLDAKPNFPANLKLANVIVVTATESDGRATPGANSGAKTVDIAVTGSQVLGLAADNTQKNYAGSAIAAARVAALAARILAANTALKGSQLKQKIIEIAKMASTKNMPVISGWIEDPAKVDIAQFK
ncbi:MAG: S8 family serine peptidase [Hyphomicrobiaceae bacterium]